MPTRGEFEDNIGAFWVPAEPARAGTRYDFRYRLHWSGTEHFPTGLARCTGTRISKSWTTDVGSYTHAQYVVIDFRGDHLAGLDPQECRVDLTFGHGGGVLEQNLSRHPGADPARWRVILMVATTGTEPLEMKLLLGLAGQPLSESWFAQLHPHPHGLR